jgi:hypothetical protein
MYNTDTELLFPPRLISSLQSLRGEEWSVLVDSVARAEPVSQDRLAFVLMMVRLAGCGSCNADSYRAMRGCTQCARQAIARFRGGDADLLKLFNAARREIVRLMEG